MKKIRLDKYLADMGVDSRTGIRQRIRQGQAAVNGETVYKADFRVDVERDSVSLQGVPVPYEEFQYFMLNKPQGVVTATRDRREKTVLELLPALRRRDLSPVGRLDKDTEGLLLITNDGKLAHRLLSPKKHVKKEYFAVIDGHVGSADQQAFREGLDIGDEMPTLPAELFILEAGGISEVIVTIEEGRFHQIKRMFEARDKRVTYLKRISMGPLKLDETLKPGQYRRLAEEEQRALLELKNGKE